MALEFKKIEAINFGGIVATPKVDVEQRLRLQNIKLNSTDGIEEAIAIVKDCFGDKGEAVEKFIRENMSIVDVIRLQAYLVGGDQLVEKIDNKVSSDKEVEDAE